MGDDTRLIGSVKYTLEWPVGLCERNLFEMEEDEGRLRVIIVAKLEISLGNMTLPWRLGTSEVDSILE